MPKTIHVCISSGSGYVIIDRAGSTRDTTCAVNDVPDDLTAALVIHKLQGLNFFPWPKSIFWPEIAILPTGSLVKTKPPS